MCSPSKGGGARIPGSEYEYLTGVFTILSGPHIGCSISVTIFRASTACGQLTFLPNTPANKKLTMLMIHSSLDIIDSSVWHATTFENLKPFCSCLGSCLGFYQPFNRYTVLDAVLVGQEAIIGGPFRFTQFRAKDGKKTVIAAAKEDVAVESFEARIWDNRCCVFSISYRNIQQK